MTKGQQTISLSIGSTPNLDAAGQVKSDYKSYMSIKEFLVNLSARDPEAAERLASMLCVELEQYRNPVVEEGFEDADDADALEQEEQTQHPDAGTW